MPWDLALIFREFLKFSTPFYKNAGLSVSFQDRDITRVSTGSNWRTPWAREVALIFREYFKFSTPFYKNAGLSVSFQGSIIARVAPGSFWCYPGVCEVWTPWDLALILGEYFKFNTPFYKNAGLSVGFQDTDMQGGAPGSNWRTA